MGKEYHLHLKGRVGAWDFSPDMVYYVLDKHKDDEVHVLIDSLGGSVQAALSISAAFKRHGKVHCHYVGMNASAATIASMGAKRVTIDTDALYLVHKCLNLVFEWDWMNADQLAAKIAKLEQMKDDQQTVDGCVAGMYASRCKGKTKDEVLALMKRGGWLTAEEALSWGFVDEITDDAEDDKPELNEEVQASLTTAGIPMPPIAVKKASVAEKIIGIITQLFTNTAARNPAHAVAGAATKQQEMENKKNDAPEQEQSKQTQAATAEPEVTNEAAAEKAEPTIAELKARIAELEALNAELAKHPADETTNVVETGRGDVDGPGADTIAEAQNLLKQLI